MVAVTWADGAVVVKQALPKLRVEADWPFDPMRTRIECECIGYLNEVLPRGTVPEVLALDAERNLLVITRAPEGGTAWKEALLAGRIEASVAQQLGDLLGTIHRTSADDARVRERFAAQWPLVQGRTDPFHRVIAARHDALRDAIVAEVERLESTRRTLVLGDYSPKNVIAYEERPPLLLDFEVAHFGDPAFDVAFMLTHLGLKARRSPREAPALQACAAAFQAAYAASAGPARPDDSAVIAELGCLLLSRVDGKSPVEYLTTDGDRDAVRGVAASLLLDPPSRVDGALGFVFSSFAGELA